MTIQKKRPGFCAGKVKQIPVQIKKEKKKKVLSVPDPKRVTGKKSRPKQYFFFIFFLTNLRLGVWTMFP